MRIAAMSFTVLAMLAGVTFGQADSTGAYKIIKAAKVGGTGRWDYVFADSADRRFFVPRNGSGSASGRVDVYDLDTLNKVGEIPDANSVHGVAIDAAHNHGFVSAKPVIMFDTKTFSTLKTIDVKGNPDGILFDPATKHILVLSHRSPNVTVLNSDSGEIVGTLDLDGEPEQAVADGNGRIFIDLENKDKVAVVDANAMKVVTDYDLDGKGGGPAGLAIDAKNKILFAFCHDPHTAVILNADDGKIITSLPIGNGVDAAEFNPQTMEAFSSQGDGTITVIKEADPLHFEVEQTVQTKAGARTSTLDTKTGNVLTVTADFKPPSTQTMSPGGRNARRGEMVKDSFTILVVGKD